MRAVDALHGPSTCSRWNDSAYLALCHERVLGVVLFPVTEILLVLRTMAFDLSRYSANECVGDSSSLIF